MKLREGLIRSRRFNVQEKRRKVTQIESMIAEFERMARDLDDQVAAEQERSGIHDSEHFAYPTYAKAAIRRRDNLMASVEELREQLRVAEREYAESVDELEKLETLAGRDHDRDERKAPAGAALDDPVPSAI